MPNRIAQSKGYALSAVITTLGTWYCTYEANRPRPFPSAVAILAISAVITSTVTFETLKQRPNWRWKEVCLLSATTAGLTHLFMLVVCLSPEKLRSPFIALGTCFAAGKLAYEVCNLMKPAPVQPPQNHNVEPSYINETLPGIVVPPYKIELCKCLYSGMSQARRDMGALKIEGKWRFNNDDLESASEEILGIATMLGIYHLFKNSFANENEGTLIFNGLYQKNPVSVEIDQEKGSWFKFNLVEFQTKLFSLNPKETELLVHHLVQADSQEITVASKKVSNTRQKEIQTLLTHLREARIVLERQFMKMSDETKDQVQFSAIFLEEIERPTS